MSPSEGAPQSVYFWMMRLSFFNGQGWFFQVDHCMAIWAEGDQVIQVWRCWSFDCVKWLGVVDVDKVVGQLSIPLAHLYLTAKALRAMLADGRFFYFWSFALPG